MVLKHGWCSLLCLTVRCTAVLYVAILSEHAILMLCLSDARMLFSFSIPS